MTLYSNLDGLVRLWLVSNVRNEAPLSHNTAKVNNLKLPSVPGVDASDPLLSQADSQIRWYDLNAQRSRRWHFRLRGAQIVFAGLVPVTQILPAGLGWRIAAGGLGGLIVVCQGFDSLHHYGEHYVAWRATCQQLIRERQLYAASAGIYASLAPDSQEARSQFATRIDLVQSEEQRRWEAGQLKSSNATNHDAA